MIMDERKFSWVSSSESKMKYRCLCSPIGFPPIVSSALKPLQIQLVCKSGNITLTVSQKGPTSCMSGSSAGGIYIYGSCNEV